MASIVVTFLLATAESGVMHERTGWPSTCTVQAPHSAIPQPNLDPVSPSWSRNAQSSGVLSGRSTVYRLPLMVTGIIVLLLSALRRHGPLRQWIGGEERSDADTRRCSRHAHPRSAGRVRRGHGKVATWGRLGASLRSARSRHRPTYPRPGRQCQGRSGVHLED